MKTVVGKVTEEEKKLIWEINKHKTSLEELIPILSPEEDIYSQAIKDLEETMHNYQDWWNTYSSKYQWEKGSCDWSIIFSTNEIVTEK